MSLPAVWRSVVDFFTGNAPALRKEIDHLNNRVFVQQLNIDRLLAVNAKLNAYVAKAEKAKRKTKTGTPGILNARAK